MYKYVCAYVYIYTQSHTERMQGSCHPAAACGLNGADLHEDGAMASCANDLAWGVTGDPLSKKVCTLHLCMRVHVYRYMCIYIYVYTDVCMCIYIHIHTYIYTHM